MTKSSFQSVVLSQFHIYNMYFHPYNAPYLTHFQCPTKSSFQSVVLSQFHIYNMHFHSYNAPYLTPIQCPLKVTAQSATCLLLNLSNTYTMPLLTHNVIMSFLINLPLFIFSKNPDNGPNLSLFMSRKSPANVLKNNTRFHEYNYFLFSLLPACP